MTSRKPVNPLLPFVLCATSVFSDDVDATFHDKDFQRALINLACLEKQIGQTAFEELLASVTRSVSESAWKQLLEATEGGQHALSGPSVRLARH